MGLTGVVYNKCIFIGIFWSKSVLDDPQDVVSFVYQIDMGLKL